MMYKTLQWTLLFLVYAAGLAFFKQTCIALKSCVWTKTWKRSKEENLIPLLCEDKNPSSVDFALRPNIRTVEAASFFCNDYLLNCLGVEGEILHSRNQIILQGEMVSTLPNTNYILSFPQAQYCSPSFTQCCRAKQDCTGIWVKTAFTSLTAAI